MANYFIQLHDRTLGPVTAAEAVGLRGFSLETSVKFSDSATANWHPAGNMPELLAAFHRLYPASSKPPSPQPAFGNATTSGGFDAGARTALSAASIKISAAPPAGEKLNDAFETVRAGWERERDLVLARWKEETEAFNSALAAMKASAEETAKLMREHQVRFSEIRLMEERAAARLEEPRKLAEEYRRELENRFGEVLGGLDRLRDEKLAGWEAGLRARLEEENKKLDGLVAAEKGKQWQQLLAWTESVLGSLTNAAPPPPGAGAQAGERNLSAAAEALMRELRGKAGAELEKKLESELPSVYAELRVHVKEETAAMIREFTAMAAAELADGHRAIEKELNPVREKLSAAASSDFEEAMRGFKTAQQAALDAEASKFRESLAARLGAAASEAGKSLDSETANLRGEISLRLGKYTTAMNGLLREMRERAGVTLEKKLDSEISAVYAVIGRRFEQEAAGMTKMFAARAAAELGPRWEKFSAAALGEYEARLRKFGADLAGKLDAAGVEAAKALEAETGILRDDLAREGKVFSDETGRLVGELREKFAAELEKRLEREIPAACADFRRRLEKETAGRLKHFAELAAEELEAGRRAVLNGLEPMWEKTSSDLGSAIEERLRGLERKTAGAQEEEVRKFREALARELDAAALEAGKTARREAAGLCEKLAREEEIFSADARELRRQLGEAGEAAAAALREESAVARGKMADEGRKLSAAREALAKEFEAAREAARRASGELTEEIKKFSEAREALAWDLEGAGEAARKALEAKAADLRGKLERGLNKFSAAGTAAAGAFDAECAALRGGLALEMKKFSAAREAILRELEAAGKAARAALGEEGRRERKTLTEEAEKLAALRGELAGEREKFSALREELAGERGKLSGLCEELAGELREFSKEREKDFSLLLDGRAAEAETLVSGLHGKIGSLAAGFQAEADGIKARLLEAAGEVENTREAVVAAMQAAAGQAATRAAAPAETQPPPVGTVAAELQEAAPRAEGGEPPGIGRGPRLTLILAAAATAMLLAAIYYLAR